MDITELKTQAREEKLKQLRFDIWTWKKMEIEAVEQHRYLYAKYCELEKDKLKKIYKDEKARNL